MNEQNKFPAFILNFLLNREKTSKGTCLYFRTPADDSTIKIKKKRVIKSAILCNYLGLVLSEEMTLNQDQKKRLGHQHSGKAFTSANALKCAIFSTLRNKKDDSVAAAQ